MKRISVINNVKVLSIVFGSIVQFGDNDTIRPRSEALAVQREAEMFYGSEGNFEHYSMFRRPALPHLRESNVQIERCNEGATIQVGAVKILAVSSASVFQVGSSRIIDSETRIKHFRQLLP